jgi:hypothetical protein
VGFATVSAWTRRRFERPAKCARAATGPAALRARHVQRVEAESPPGKIKMQAFVPPSAILYAPYSRGCRESHSGAKLIPSQ